MKFFVLFLVFVSAQAARVKFARVEAPYPTAGYPQGPSLNLPGEYGQPEDAYGSPGSSSANPDATPNNPEDAYGSPNKPEDAYGKPGSASQQPEDAYGKPESASQEPEDAYGKPESASQEPEDAYGKPESASQEPEDAYGSPEGQTPTTERADVEETDLPAGDSIAVSNGESRSQKLRKGKRVENVNVYYVYTPNGLIQYSRNPSPSGELNSAYTSGVYYQDVQNPVYSFTPENYF